MAEEKKETLEQETVETPVEETAETPVDEAAEAAQGAEQTAEENAAETTEEAGPGEQSEASEEKKDGKGWGGFGFGKNKKDDKKDQQIAELTDKVKRQMAEFDNFRKRTEKEKSAMFEVGAKSVLEKLLPVVDNFERGLAAIPEADKKSSTAVGMEMIYKQLMKALEEMDVKPIEAVGQEFSPDFHNAVMQCEEEGVEENIIVEEFQKGYLYRGNVLRYSMVKVNK